MHLHYRTSGLYLFNWCFIVIGVDRAINNVQEFMESMSVIISGRLISTFGSFTIAMNNTFNLYIGFDFFTLERTEVYV